MRVLVFGAGGMLGQAVVAAFRPFHEVIEATWNPETGGVDIGDPASVRAAVKAAQPELMINCAAWTDVDGAESNLEEAMRLNAFAPVEIGIVAAGLEIPILHMSTDYVFDGNKGEPYDELDTPNPDNAYGLSKWCGEDILAKVVAKHWIVRTQWLYGVNGRNFPLTMLRLAGERDHIGVVNDQYGCPTYTRDLAQTLKMIVEECPYGLYHANNDGETTWYEFARAVLEEAGLDPEIIQPITTDQYPTPARRPKRSTLRRMKLQQQGRDTARPWREALRDFITEARSAGII